MAALLAQSGSGTEPRFVAVVVSACSGVPRSTGSDLAKRLSEQLERSQVQVALQPEDAQRRLSEFEVTDTAACDGRSDCVAKYGALLNVPYVVAIEVRAVGHEVGVRLLAVATRGARPVLEKSFMTSARSLVARFPALSQPFATELGRELSRKGPDGAVANGSESRDRGSDVPRAQGEPALRRPQWDEGSARDLDGRTRVEPGEPGVRVGTLAAGAGAIGSALAATGFLIAGLRDKGELDASRVKTADGREGTSLSPARAQELQSRANTEFSVAAGLGALSLVLGGLAAYFYSTGN